MAVILVMGLIKVVCTLYTIVTFPVYYLVQMPWKKRSLSNRVKAVPVTQDSEQITYTSVDKPNFRHRQMLENKLNTLENMFNFVVKIHKQKRCLGTREILGEEDEMQPDGRPFKKYVLGDYKWWTFTETDRMAQNFGRGLRELGVQPKSNVVIFAETRAEWTVAAHGAFKHNMTVVTIYATLGEEGIVHGVGETEVDVVITTHELMPKFRNILNQLPKVKKIIYMEDQLHKTDVTGYRPDVQIMSFNHVLKLGSQAKHEGVAPKPDDIAIIMYTSGSTGTPKGVLLSHYNCITTMKAFCDVFEIYDDDVLIGFLPLAHVFELVAESVCLLTGVPIGYSTALTLIDSSSKIKRGGKGDATVLKPTCMTCVPLILDRIAKGIHDKVNKEKPLKKALFKYAYEYKSRWMNRGYGTPLADLFVFKKVASLLGGRIRSVASGGAPLSPDTHEAVKICLCVDMIQGYGLTESTSGCAVTEKWDLTYGRTGAPSTVHDVRLINWEEGNYRVTNKPHPQGEILIGSTSVAMGYYKLPEKSKEEFFTEFGKRWFRTGDIGEVHADGALKIIDRKKDLVKLQAGEYVSLGKVEAQMKTCPIVENMCVYADPMKQFAVALVVPNPVHLERIANQEGVTSTDIEALCANPKIIKAALKEIADHGKKTKLAKFEVPAKITLCSEIWTPDMGLVTAAFKLKRKDIQNKYQREIDQMYS